MTNDWLVNWTKSCHIGLKISIWSGVSLSRFIVVNLSLSITFSLSLNAAVALSSITILMFMAISLLWWSSSLISSWTSLSNLSVTVQIQLSAISSVSWFVCLRSLIFLSAEYKDHKANTIIFCLAMHFSFSVSSPSVASLLARSHIASWYEEAIKSRSIWFRMAFADVHTDFAIGLCHRIQEYVAGTIGSGMWWRGI